jgi:hypothetical protein
MLQFVIGELQVEHARRILTNWANLQGHENCWHHPEILTELCRIFEIPIPTDRGLPPRPEFREGCHQHEALLYDNQSQA